MVSEVIIHIDLINHITAFEIYLGDELIWSKLEAGRVPSPVELIQAIESHLQIAGANVGLGSDTFGAIDN